MFFRIYRYRRVCVLLTLIFLMVSVPLFSKAQNTEFPAQRLAAIFPKAKKFVQKSAVLTPDKIASIENEIGDTLRATDLKPIFYIPINEANKPIGLVWFVNVEGPSSVIEGAVGLNMQGKVVKVAVYDHKETDAIAREVFLKQFIGMGIDNAFKVGEDVDAAGGHEATLNAVALLPKKTLVMSYALFLKRKPKLAPEAKTPAPDTPEEMPEEEEMPEVEDLKALMMLMIDDYFIVLDYFDDTDDKGDKSEAVAAAKRLAKYAKAISNFEPPKNADQTEEYVYLQDKFSDTLLKFADALETDGVSEETRKQWDAIVELINQAHLRFSLEEIDLDTY